MRRRYVIDDNDDEENEVIIGEESNESNGSTAVVEKQLKRLSIHHIDNNLEKENIKPKQFQSEKEKKRYYNQLVRSARDLEKEGQDPITFLHLYEEAYTIFDVDDKLKNKIVKYRNIVSQKKDNQIETKQSKLAPFTETSFLNTSHTNESSKRFNKLDNGFICDTKTKQYCLLDAKSKKERKIPFKIPEETYDKLYDYQKEGILWFWEKHSNIKDNVQGGILGDDMGLGKTIQVITFLTGLFAGESVKHVLIAMPVSLVENWRKEFDIWGTNDYNLFIFHNLTKKQRKEILEQYKEEGGVLITTYGTIVSQIKLFEDNFINDGYEFDYIILDEGHKIKNPDIKLTKCLKILPSTMCRYVISGTPIQNNLLEMHTLMDWIFKGKLLGDRKTFREEFEKKIVRGNEKDASIFEKKLGIEIQRKFREVIAPHVLRREKAQVLTKISSSGSSSSKGKTVSIGKKNDLVVWLKSTDTQLKLYRDFLGSEEVRDVLNESASPLAAITILKQICCHPDLVPNNEKTKNIKETVSASGKLIFLKLLVEQLYKEGEKVLIFSQSSKMLDIIANLLRHIKISYTRIDGSINDPKERQRRVDAFNAEDSPYFCFLLTSQTGSVGLTLTGATRVVIFDPSWNPTSDSQAADRAYRVGQKKDVIIYRLITCSTIEEKVYRKQVFKEAICKSTMQKENQYRYFTRGELRELFSLPQNPNVSETQIQLEKIHSEDKRGHYTSFFKQHLESLKKATKHIVFGFSDHDLLYSREADDLNGMDTQTDQREIISMAEDATEALLDSSFTMKPNEITSDAIKAKTGKAKRGQKLTNSGSSANNSRRNNDFSNPSEFLVPLSKVQQVGDNQEETYLSHINTTSLSNSDCKQLIKGVRTYGESMWRRILEQFLPNCGLSAIDLENEWKNLKMGKTHQHLMEILTHFDNEFKVKPELPKIRLQAALLVDPNNMRKIPKIEKKTNSSPVFTNEKVEPKTPPKNSISNNNEDDMFLSPIASNNNTDSNRVGRKSTMTFEQIQRRLSTFLGLINEDDEDFDPPDDEEEEILENVRKVEEEENSERINDEFPIYHQDNKSEVLQQERNDVQDENPYIDEEQYNPPNSYNVDESTMMATTPITSTKKGRKVIDDSDDEERYHTTPNYNNQLQVEQNYSPMAQTPINDNVPQSTPTQEDEQLDEQTRERYVNLLREANHLEQNGNLLGAMQMYLNALEVSDIDLQLHCKINVLAKHLGFTQ
ncbi:hypothetical protein ABK040_005342 [Willaertia magna]